MASPATAPGVTETPTRSISEGIRIDLNLAHGDALAHAASWCASGNRRPQTKTADKPESVGC